jgi:hypothetical protein
VVRRLLNRPRDPTTNLECHGGHARACPIRLRLGQAATSLRRCGQSRDERIVGFWATKFQKLSSSPYKRLAGKVYAGYPSRTDIPACGGSVPIDYATELKGNAFYCPTADYVAYDDQSPFPAVYGKLGAVSLGVILAHEMGDDAQAQVGVPSNNRR